MPGPLVGIDVGKETCHACIIPAGSTEAEAIHLRESRATIASAVLTHLRDDEPATIALELTGNLALPIIEAFEATPHTIMIAQHTDSVALRTLLRMRRKADKLDAVLIARLAVLLLADQTTSLVSAKLTPWSQMRSAILGRTRTRHLQTLIRDRTRLTLRHQAATHSESRADITAQLATLNAIIPDAEARMIASASPSTDLLVTIPLITARRAAILDAAIGDVSRFPSADHLAKYCQVVPGHRPQSGAKTATAGRPRSLRLLATELHMIAITSANPRTKASTKGVLGATYERVKQRTGDGRKALWAVKRQVIRIAWGVLTSGQPHTPQRSTPCIPSSAASAQSAANTPSDSPPSQPPSAATPTTTTPSIPAAT